LIGFLDGPAGVMKGRYKELCKEELDTYRNTGGFHLLGSGRDKIEKPDQMEAAAKVCTDLDLDGLIVIGGDDSNTNAAVLAEYFSCMGLKIKVIGVPKTIDGDLKNEDVAISFGFDTACKVYSEIIGNIMIDCASAKKYYHFIRIMGRSASHVALECALQTHPQWTFISEEVETQKYSLQDVAKKLCDIVEKRADDGKNYGVILLPEGLIEFVYDMKELIVELNELLVSGSVDGDNLGGVSAALGPQSQAVFNCLSEGFQREFLTDRDPHGNVQVSHIETEKLLIRLVETELAIRKAAGTFKGKFNGVGHFCGYEGRSALPSNFDCSYTYALGQAAAALCTGGATGMMATVSNLEQPAVNWCVGGTPLVSLMCIERRHGKDKPVIKKALVELEGMPFKTYAAVRERWARCDAFRSPGPMQFKGHYMADGATITLALEVNKGQPILVSPTADCLTVE
jgi:pyrophosphate--fructose-6-phosphate 1-phosphotransferase